MNKIEKGKVIKIKKEHHQYLKDTAETLKSYQEQVLQLSTVIKVERDKMWKFIKDVYKETDQCDLSYDEENQTLLIIDKKE